MDKDQFPFFIGVHKALHLTPSRYQQLKTYFDGHWKDVFECSIHQLQEVGFSRESIEKFLTARKNVHPHKELEKLQKMGIQTLVYGEGEYPPVLENIPSPPIVLFVRGILKNSYFPSVSVVGSRGITAYGRRALEEIVGVLADHGVTIVSGFAMGADTWAHRTALAHGSQTICVLGNGIDSIYPRQNQKLADQILEQNRGCFLSEYFPGVEARPNFFPIRNRIVAGLSKATIVIEAALKSGSQITARMAVEAGRDVFAVPGDIFAKFSKGCNELILNGEANPVLSGGQVLEVLGLQNISTQKQIQEQIPFTDIEQQIIDLFENEEKMHIDELLRLSPLSSSVLTAHVSLMEIKGILKNIGNQTYLKNF